VLRSEDARSVVGGGLIGSGPLERLADSQIRDSGATALAAALPQMLRLTTLDLGGTTMLARCGFLLLGIAHGWLGGSSRRVLRRAGARSEVGGGLFRVGAAVRLARLADSKIGDAGVTALAAALPQMRSVTTLKLSSTATRARCGLLLFARLPEC
jgi:hypothetical protein